MTCPAAFNQKAFRGRNDDGNETTATWKAAQNTNWSNLEAVNLRVRFEIQETAACAGNNKVWQLQYNKNAAGWVTVNATSANVISFASPNLADAANLTDQLTAGTGTFQGATGFDEVNGAAGGSSMDVAASGHAEAEFCVQIVAADTVPGDTIQLRVTDNGTALAAYDVTPTVTVDSGAVTVTPGVGALDLTGFAPTVLTPVTVTPGVGALDVTGFAPTVTASSGTVVTPGVGALDLTGFAPTVTATANITVTPGVGALDLTGFAPTIQTPVTVTPGVGALDLTGFAPTIQTPVTVTPGVGAVDLTGFVPTITVSGGGAIEVTPGVGEIIVTGFAPTVTAVSGGPGGDSAAAIVHHMPGYFLGQGPTLDEQYEAVVRAQAEAWLKAREQEDIEIIAIVLDVCL